MRRCNSCHIIIGIHPRTTPTTILFGHVNPFRRDFGHPHFERLGLGRGNRLYDTKHLLGGSHIRHAHLAVCGPQFQPVTVCHGFISLGFEALFQLPPVGKRILAFGQHRPHIDNGEVPNLRLVIPNGANLSIPENFIISCLDISTTPICWLQVRARDNIHIARFRLEFKVRFHNRRFLCFIHYDSSFLTKSATPGILKECSPFNSPVSDRLKSACITICFTWSSHFTSPSRKSAKNTFVN